MKTNTPTVRNRIRIKFAGLACALIFLIIGLACSSSHRFIAPAPMQDDRRDCPQPESVTINAYAEYFNKQVSQQVEESFDLSRQLRNLFSKRKEALNVNAFDEVDNSSWFTNRNAHQRMSLEALSRGPNTGNGPDTSGIWLIKRAKAEGVTPGFTIKDRHGYYYLIKFDPIGYSELASGAEVVSTKLFYAAGFFTPENYVTYFHPRILQMDDKVKYTDEKGRKRFMNADDLQELLGRVQHLPDGRIRALASKYIPPEPIGPFKYKGTRKDDPNDLVPHQHRRELRGLRVIAAWLNHFDTKDGNSLDSYVVDGDKHYVRHYLIDFGATLGSASHGPNHPWRGHQNEIDPHVITENIASLGLYVRPWEKFEGIKYPSVGLFEAEAFHPQKYKPQVPNPAFESMTDRDGYWGAKIVMSFTDAQLETAIKQGQYSDPDAAAYLLRTLIERRDKIGRYYFNKIIPLDNFEISETEGADAQLVFKDLAIETELVPANETEYRFDLSCNGVPILTEQKVAASLSIQLPTQQMISKNDFQTADDLQWEIKIQLKRNASNKWSRWIKIYLNSDPQLRKFKLIGLKRQG